jgi:MerR family copper efflux transcriptional regulator
MLIGEAARSAGLDPSAIRFYEDQGVVPSPQRSESGYRTYTQDDVALLRFVRRLRSLELPLTDVSQIVSLWAEGNPPCSAVRESITREAAAIDARIDDLVRLRDELRRLEEAADSVVDNWPTSCVCHVVEPASRSRED